MIYELVPGSSPPPQGEALYAMELALSLEKLNFQKLRELHAVADKHGDASMTDFVGACACARSRVLGHLFMNQVLGTLAYEPGFGGTHV